MDFSTITESALGGNLLGTIPLGDIVLYVTPFNLFLFACLLVFTFLIAMMCSLPLFGGASIILASTGTLSLAVLSQITPSPMVIFGAILMLIGIIGESGVAPFFATKAEMFRTPGSPFLVIIHLSSLFIIIRAIEILLIILM